MNVEFTQRSIGSLGFPEKLKKIVTRALNSYLKTRIHRQVANINPLMLFNGSVYWIDPESHDCFNGDKDTIFEDNDRYIPSSKWYSVDPFIDSDVRRKRYNV